MKTHICQFCGKSYTQETYLAKHMQKHADRMEKRSTGILSRGGHSGGDPYAWAAAKQPGMAPHDCGPELQTHHHHHHNQLQAEQQACSVLPGGDGRGYARQDPMDHVRGGHPQLAGNNGRSSEELLYNVEQKQTSSASAFTPIQSSMLSSASARNAVAAAYFPYESFGFAKGSGGGMDMKSMEGKTAGHTSFPNQLIALHQIRNYASMPGSASSMGDPIKEKGGQQ